MQTYPPGTRIGQYEIASRPMMGGMGVVYYALDHGNDGRPVAIKTFRPELLPDRAARDRFLREGTAWIELGSHPHIVRCYKVEYIDPTAFLVLELIAKEQNMPDPSLRSWLIPGHPLPIEQALLFALQIARGMQYATEKIPGFVHRDLKPENILVGADKLPGTNINRLRVTDFGLVKTVAGSGSQVIANGADEEFKPNQVQFTRGAGTPLYMAPEQWRGEEVGVYTDVYALGCILYEMLMAQRAANGKNLNDLQSAHCLGKLSAVPETLPHKVKALLMRCFALHPIKRYQGWGEITRELEQVYTDLTGNAVPVEMSVGQANHEENVQSGWSYNAIGLAYLDVGRAEVALGYFEKSLSIARDQGDRIGEGATLLHLGLLRASLGEVRRAISYYEQYLVISREIGNRRGEGAALANLGVAYRNLGETQRAIGHHEQALEIAREIGDRRVESVVLGNLGSAYHQIGEVQRAVGYHEQALAIDREIEDRRGQGNDLGNLGLAYAELGEVQRAVAYFEQQLAIDRQIGHRHGEGNALRSLGNTYYRLGKVQQAIVYHGQALEIAREIRDRRVEGAVLQNMGIAYADMGEVRQAVNYYEQSLAITRELEDRRGEGAALSSLGQAYADLGEVQRAITYSEQALAIDHEIGDLNGMAIDSFNIALYYTKQGETARALPLAQEAVHIWTRIGSPNVQVAQRLVSQILANQK